jgi:hypothetical protein
MQGPYEKSIMFLDIIIINAIIIREHRSTFGKYGKSLQKYGIYMAKALQKYGIYMASFFSMFH